MIECSLPEKFVEGLAAAVLFRLCRPWRGMVETTISIVDGDRVVAGPAVRRGTVPEYGAEMSLNVRPPEAGALSVEVRVENRYDGATETEVFTAPLLLLVQPRDEAQTPIIIQNGPNSPILGDFANGLPRVETAADRLRAVANPRVFHPLDLLLVSGPTRLTLHTPAGLLHLVSRAPAWFGRQGEKPEKGRVRDNAVVLRLAPDAPEELSCAFPCVSRTHFLVEKDGAACRVRDGAPARDDKGNILPGGVVSGSRFGLAVDGESLSPCGWASVPVGESRTLSLAPSVREGGAFSLELHSLPDAERPSVSAGALLRRADGREEAYLPLWGTVDLGAFAPELAGISVRWDGARFSVGQAGRPESPLASGDSFGPDSWRCVAAAFSQL